MTAGRRRCRGDGGSITIEWVLIFPALMLVVFLGIQYALWAHYKQVAVAAAKDAATEIASGSPASAAVVASYLSDYGGGRIEARSIEVDVSADAGGQPDVVTVTIEGEAPAILDLFDLPLRVQAQVPSERFRP